jgi:hypothetical protein
MKPFNFLLKIFLLFWLFSPIFASVPLAPRSGASGKMDMFGCMQSNDFYIANFAAYPLSQLKDKTPLAPYCLDLAYTGKTQITLDLLDRDVRRKNIWLKVFDAHRNLVAQTSPKIEKQGVITTTVDFANQGKYDVVLYVEDYDLNTAPEMSALHIPVMVAVTAVGEPASAGSFLKVIVAVATVALGIGLLVNYQLKPKVSV